MLENRLSGRRRRDPQIALSTASPRPQARNPLDDQDGIYNPNSLTWCGDNHIRRRIIIKACDCTMAQPNNPKPPEKPKDQSGLVFPFDNVISRWKAAFRETHREHEQAKASAESLFEVQRTPRRDRVKASRSIGFCRVKDFSPETALIREAETLIRQGSHRSSKTRFWQKMP
jgi:hypothetical protein